MTTLNTHTDVVSKEPWLHAFARESRNMLRLVVLALMLATVITMVTFPFWGIFPAILLLLAYGLLWVANIAEHRSRTGMMRCNLPAIEHEFDRVAPVDADELAGECEAEERTETPEALKEIPVSTLLKESISAAEIVIGAAVAATIVAALMFHWTMLAIAVLFLFPYMIILLAPVWLGSFSRELQDQEIRQQQREDVASA